MTFLFFLSIRCLMAIISRGYFVPDETWQSVEVAHKLIFGNGYLTWEWHHGLRSYAHPLIFSAPFYVLKQLSLDSPFLIVIFPKLFQGILSAVSDVAVIKAYSSVFGRDKVKTFGMLYATQWFLLYSMSRTLINTFEANLTNIALLLFVRKDSKYVSVIAACFMVRPTTAIFWLPLVVYDVLKRSSWKRLILKMIPQAFLTTFGMILCDSAFYGKLTIVPWNFLQINLVNDISLQYGTHPWHWYLTNFLPALTLVVGFVPLFKGMLRTVKKGNELSKILLASYLWTFAAYSCLGHKEHRFLLPLVPLTLAWMSSEMDRKSTQLFCVLNVALSLFLSLSHQMGPHGAIEYLTSRCQTNGILYLTPCHGTPYYSHIHRNVPMRFLECPPDLGDGPKDHSELFKKNPLKWMHENVRLNEYDHVVFFDKWEKILQTELRQNGLAKCGDFWHTFFPESSTSETLLVYCRQNKET